MKCNKAQEWISLQMDGQLPAEHVPVLNEHLGGCAACRRYCDDLLAGRRLLVCTNPAPPDNFDWKLQLRLNHVLREAAREVSYPWPRPLAGWRRWMSRAGLSAAVGLGAVLALSMVVPGPTLFLQGQAQPQVAVAEGTPRLPFRSPEQRPQLFDNSRRPLDSQYAATAWPQGFGVQRQTSVGGGLGQRLWPVYGGEHEQVRIRLLEQDVQALRRLLNMRDRKLRLLEAKLDSLQRLTVDTPWEN